MKKLIFTVILTLAVSGTRVGMGLFNSITGPTLFYLADNINSSISTVSYMFLGRSGGVLVGAVLGGLIKRWNPRLGQLGMLGIAVGFLGVSMLVVPWLSSLWMLIVDLAMGGIMYGYLDAGLQALLLQIWGDVESRVHVQMFHFTYVVGATFAPLIVKPFLLAVDGPGSKNSRCGPGETDAYNISDEYSTFPPETTAQYAGLQDKFNPVGWAYIICALWMIMIAVFVTVLAKCDLEGKMTSRQGDSYGESREEEPLRDVIWLFLPTLGYYLCSVATQNVFYNFIYSITICSDLGFTVSQATLANSLVWIGLGVGRLLGVIVSKYLAPRTIIIVTIAASIVDSLVMVIFGEQHAWVSWTVAFLHGLTPSVMFPSGVSWISEITNVSITYMSIFTIGVFLATFTMLPLAGYIFDNISPFSVIIQCFILAAANAVFYALALYAGKRHKMFLKRKKLGDAKNDEMRNLNDCDNLDKML